MFLQTAVMDVFPERLDQFLELSGPMLRTLSEVPGVIAVTLTTDLSSPSRVIGLVRWESPAAYEAHLGLLDRVQWREKVSGEFLRKPLEEEFFTKTEMARHD
jgi:quinol monooxygenase YgiN